LDDSFSSVFKLLTLVHKHKLTSGSPKIAIMTKQVITLCSNTIELCGVANPNYNVMNVYRGTNNR
jgi:hypothetical protein